MNRCPWSEASDILREYHDKEWGVPVHEDRKLFEFIILDAFQAGLSWGIILKKREGFREAFENFEPEKISKFNDSKITGLLTNSNIIRNKMKINSAIENSRRFLEIKSEFGSFDKYIWQFTNGITIKNSWTDQSQIPASTPLSDTMSKDLKQRGFKFVGTTICYSFMQAAGMINDHLISCFRYKEV